MISTPLYRIVVTGPESTGKSQTSQDLARALGTVWVPEYARTYLEALDRPYEEEDLLKIAQGQIEWETQKAAQADRFLLCDTDLYVIKIWSEYRFGRCDPWILEQIALRPYDFYFLSYIDVPWEDDPLREHPDPRERELLFRYHLDHVLHSGTAFQILKGDASQRCRQAMETISKRFNLVNS